MKRSLVLITLLFVCNVIYSQNRGLMTDSRDGHQYKWVKIGTQIWMAENLAYLPSVYSMSDKRVHGHKILPPSSRVPFEINSEPFETPFQFVFDYYGSDVKEAKATTNYKIHGVLYNHVAAMESCPKGWHLPSDKEWMELEIYIGIEEADLELSGYPNGMLRGEVAYKLKSTKSWPEGIKCTDEYGFCAIASGFSSINIDVPGNVVNGYFSNLGINASFWTSQNMVDNMIGFAPSARSRRITNKTPYVIPFNNSSIIRIGATKSEGLSVRCIKD